MNPKHVYSGWFSLLIFLFLSIPARSQSDASITIGKMHKLYSRRLGEERLFWVSLPESYETDEFYIQKRYPVVILLDADTHFRYVSSMIQFLSAAENEQVPEMIVVAVGNTNRTRDMTAGLQGGSDNFLDFLEKELLPHVDHQYRKLPSRLLIGHSLAGLFALNCLLNQRSFTSYIAIDPTLAWDNEYLLKKARSVFKANTSLSARLYLTQADNPFETGQHTGARGKVFDAFRTSLAENRSRRLTHQFAYYGQENHFSVPLRSIHDGLLFIFEKYAFPFATFLKQGSPGVSAHYRQLTDQLGVGLLPPGKVINQAGLFILHSQKQADNALDLLKLNAGYYPDSPVVYRSLGEAYRAKGDTIMAVQAYRKAQTLRATDEKANKALLELTRQ